MMVIIMNLLIYLKEWWIDVFYPKQLTDSSLCLLNFDIERSLNIMGIKYSSKRNNLSSSDKSKTINYKVYDLILHTIYWIKYFTFFFVNNQDYWITLSDYSLPFGRYRSWALYLYFMAYTGISVTWYIFQSFPKTKKNCSWLIWYSKCSDHTPEQCRDAYNKLQNSTKKTWSLLQWSLIYGTAVPHFVLIVSPAFYATNWFQFFISLISSLLTMQRVVFIIRALQIILFLFMTFVMICDYQVTLWRQSGLTLIETIKSISNQNFNQFANHHHYKKHKFTDDNAKNNSHLINHLHSLMKINQFHASGNRILSRIGGLIYLQSIFTTILNMYIVFFISVSIGVRIMTVVSLTVALIGMVILLPMICRSVNHSNKLTRKMLHNICCIDVATISTRLKAQTMLQFNIRYPIGITFFTITPFDSKLLVNTLLELASLMFLLVIQTRSLKD